jgi:methyl-accepting chemotaxis protein
MKSVFRFLSSLLAFGKRQFRGVAGARALLPVLRAQLADMSRQVEQSVVAVCGSFNDIATRSRKAVAQTAELLGGDREQHNATVERSIETSRLAIAGLLEEVERSAGISAMVVSRMEQVEKSVASVETMLEEVEKIAFSNKLLSLNAKIEAVHVGRLGSGFEIVADEIARQARRSDELAEGIGSAIEGMRETVRSGAAELRAFVAEDREKLARSKADAETALNLLWSLHQRSRDSLAVMTRENGHLADEIAAAVVGLQFQDRVSQLVSHVIQALETMEQNLGGAVPSSPAPGAEPEHALVAQVRASYTMESEREVMARTLQEPPQAAQGSDVELF